MGSGVGDGVIVGVGVSVAVGLGVYVDVLVGSGGRVAGAQEEINKASMTIKKTRYFIIQPSFNIVIIIHPRLFSLCVSAFSSFLSSQSIHNLNLYFRS